MATEETDDSEGRWKKEEWRNFELWEKIEKRFRQRRRIQILFVFIVFFVLSAIPVFREKRDFWAAQSMTQLLALKLHLAQTLSFQKRKPLLIEVKNKKDEVLVHFSVVSHCDDFSQKKLIFKEKLKSLWGRKVKIVSELEAKNLGIPNLTNSLCFDPIAGFHIEKYAIAFAFWGKQDQKESNLERMGFLMLEEDGSKINFY